MDATFGPSALATPANALTLARIAITPVFIVLIIARGVSWAAFLVGFALALSDVADGYIARRQGQTRSGAFLDPLADKFTVLGGMYACVVKGIFWWLPVTLIAVREGAISLYRAIAGRRGITVPARQWAKVKAVVQAFALAMALLPWVGNRAEWIGGASLWIAVALTLVTGANYLLDARRAAADQLGGD